MSSGEGKRRFEAYARENSIAGVEPDESPPRHVRFKKPAKIPNPEDMALGKEKPKGSIHPPEGVGEISPSQGDFPLGELPVGSGGRPRTPTFERERESGYGIAEGSFSNQRTMLKEFRTKVPIQRKWKREMRKSEGQGELGDCLEYYLDTPNASLWRLLEPVPEAVPDQGIERTHEGSGTPSTDVKDDKGTKRGADGSDKKEQSAKVKTCLVCGKKHEPLCPLPPNFRKEQREAKKAAKAKKRQETGKKPEK